MRELLFSYKEMYCAMYNINVNSFYHHTYSHNLPLSSFSHDLLSWSWRWFIKFFHCVWTSTPLKAVKQLELAPFCTWPYHLTGNLTTSFSFLKMPWYHRSPQVVTFFSFNTSEKLYFHRWKKRVFSYVLF